MFATYEQITKYKHNKTSIAMILENTLIFIRNILDCDVCQLIMFNDDKSCAITKISCEKNGSTEIKGYDFLLRAGNNLRNSFLNLVIEKNQVVIYCNSGEDEQYLPLYNKSEVECYIPLFKTNDTSFNIIGCLYLGSFSQNSILTYNALKQEQILQRLQFIEERFAILYDEFKKQRNLFKIIHILNGLVIEKDNYLSKHNYNVSYWANEMANRINLEVDKNTVLYLAALLHDIGKLYISDEIVGKIGKLTEEEYELMKKHPHYSYIITKELLGSTELKNIPLIVKHHHEKYDGTGYPDGLKGEDIPLESRIITMADAVDSMLSDRSYKKSMSVEDAINDIVRNRGKHFDPQLADIMIEILTDLKNREDKKITEPIIRGTLNVVTTTGFHILQGELIKGEEGFIFLSNTDLNKINIDIADITGLYFYFEKRMKIHEYTAKLISIKENRIYISSLKLNPCEEYFSILCNLNGTLHINKKISFNISITRIGGNTLSFLIPKEQLNFINLSENLEADIMFEDGSKTKVMGKPVNTFNMGQNVLCDLQYVNIPESSRDNIFKQIFSMQAKLRGSILMKGKSLLKD